MPITNVAGCNALQPSTSLMVSLSNHAPWLCHPPIKQKSHQLIQHVPSALILLVSFPAGMLPETFESRERIGASACGRTPGPGRFSPILPCWTKPFAGWVVQGIATTATPTKDLSALDGPPVFPTFQQPDAKAGVATGRALQNNHAPQPRSGYENGNPWVAVFDQCTRMLRNCQGSLVSMSSLKKPGRFSSGVQSV